MVTRVLPDFLPQNYEAIKRLMKDDRYLPKTYNEWLDLITDRAKQIESEGHTVKKVNIDPNEFAAYCDRAGLDYNLISAGAGL